MRALSAALIILAPLALGVLGDPDAGEVFALVGTWMFGIVVMFADMVIDDKKRGM